MKRQPGAWVIALISWFGLSGCSSTISVYSRPLTGQVVDPRNNPVGGVEVRVRDRLLQVTDANGEFAIAVPMTDRLAVSFSAPAFMSTTRIYDAPRGGGTVVVVWPRATPARLRASEGGQLSFPGGTIVFPPDAFVDANGQPVKGEVNVSMSVVDLSDPRQLASVPGDFTARMRDGSIRNLETFGLFEIVASDGDGLGVQLARDRPARVNLTVANVRGDVPRSVGAFRFDAQTGRWNEQSSFELQSAEEQRETLQTWVSSWGWWNADQPYDTTCLTVQVLGCRGCEANSVGIAGATVTATGTDYIGEVTTGTTDISGFVCLPAKKAAHVRLSVTSGGFASNHLDVATDPNVLDPATCSSCPLVTATHTVAPPIVLDPLASHDGSVWCASDYWNGSTTEFGSAWLYDPQSTHVTFSSVGLTLTLDDEDDANNQCDPNPTGSLNCHGATYASGEYKTKCFHRYGTYTAKITPPPYSLTNANQGIVTGFFTYTINGIHDGTVGENNPLSSWDEVDVEILGRWPNGTDCNLLRDCDALNTRICANTDLVVQTNYIGKGIGFGVNEQRFCLPYDTHTYTFTWTDSSISWSYVDSSNVSHLLRDEQRNGKPEWPTQPGRVFLNLWANNTGDSWVGPFSYPGTPIQAVFSNVSVP